MKTCSQGSVKGDEQFLFHRAHRLFTWPLPSLFGVWNQECFRGWDIYSCAQNPTICTKILYRIIPKRQLTHAQKTHVPFVEGCVSSGSSTKCLPASATLMIVILPLAYFPAFFEQVTSPPVLTWIFAKVVSNMENCEFLGCSGSFPLIFRSISQKENFR